MGASRYVVNGMANSEFGGRVYDHPGFISSGLPGMHFIAISFKHAERSEITAAVTFQQKTDPPCSFSGLSRQCSRLT